VPQPESHTFFIVKFNVIFEKAIADNVIFKKAIAEVEN